MASQLLDDLGRQYVNDRFHQALFRIDDTIYSFARVENGTNEALVEKMPDNDRHRWTAMHIPVDLLKDFTTFSIPKLGYRNILFGDVNAVINLSCVRSTQRGFKLDHVTYSSPPVYGTLGISVDDIWETQNKTQRVRVIYFPKFPSIKEGLKDMLAGQSAGCALSPDAAIFMDLDCDAEFPWSIVFKGKPVGGVDEHGQIVVRNKVVSRSSLRKLLDIN